MRGAATRPIRSRFGGTCPQCGTRYEEGDPVTKRPGHPWEHAACPDAEDLTPPADVNLCHACHTYHRGECL